MNVTLLTCCPVPDCWIANGVHTHGFPKLTVRGRRIVAAVVKESSIFRHIFLPRPRNPLRLPALWRAGHLFRVAPSAPDMVTIWGPSQYIRIRSFAYGMTCGYPAKNGA
jgi:hypothetical protein